MQSFKEVALMLREKQKRNQIRAKRVHLLKQIDNLGQQFNVTNDWRAREVIKQQIITLGQELENAKGKHHEL